jgi:hypothetical protein
VQVSGDVICARCEEREEGRFPLEQRRELGLGVAVARTIVGVLLHPHAFFAQRARERSLWPVLIFGLVIHVIASAAHMGVSFAFAAEARAVLRADPVLSQMPWLESDALYIARFALSPITFFLGIYFLATMWWIALRAVGGARRPFHVVVRALCLSSATAVLAPIVDGLLPAHAVGAAIFFAYVGWALSVQIIAVSRMQGISLARGTVAFLLCVVLAACVFCIASLVLAVPLASQIRIPNV